MSRVTAKVYGAFFPASEETFQAVREAGKSAIGTDFPWLEQEKNMIRLSWEGIYFPLEEVLEALNRFLPEQAQGKLDVLDLDGWTLTRYVREPVAPVAKDAAQSTSQKPGFAVTTRGLNSVLDYSGH